MYVIKADVPKMLLRNSLLRFHLQEYIFFLFQYVVKIICQAKYSKTS